MCETKLWKLLEKLHTFVQIAMRYNDDEFDNLSEYEYVHTRLWDVLIPDWRVLRHRCISVKDWTKFRRRYDHWCIERFRWVNPRGNLRRRISTFQWVRPTWYDDDEYSVE